MVTCQKSLSPQTGICGVLHELTVQHNNEYERFPEALTVTMDLPIGNSRYAWIDELDDPALVDFVKALSERDRELITLLAFDDSTHQEAANQFGITRSGVTKRVEQLRKIYQKNS